MLREKWRLVRDEITNDIANGRLSSGDKLPTEPELAERFGVGRHSVRRAIKELAMQGQLSVEQGRGTFVEATPVIEYAIGKRTRLSQNLAGQAQDIDRRALSAQIIPARDRVREALQLPQGAEVSQSRRISYADGVPLAFGSIYHDVTRFPDFADRRSVMGSTTATYRSYGIEDYLRGGTTIHSRRARGEEAKMLNQHPQMPVMVVRSIDTLLDGTPISFSEGIWSAARVRFTFSNEDPTQ